ncbi:MAG: helix-turn-helix domain-containing protein [Sneathiella sp.]
MIGSGISQISCPQHVLDYSLKLLGERWTLLIIKEACAAPCRFDEICLRLGISRTTLALRLRTLVEAEILMTSPIPCEPNRQYYRLSEQGEGLRIIVEMIAKWSEELNFEDRRKK